MDLTDIRTDARYAISPQITSVEYPDADLDRNANRWYKKVVGWVVALQGDWQMGGDIITRDFEAGVTTYDLPEGLLRIYKGEVLYTAGGSFVPLEFMDPQRNQALVEGNATRTIDDVNAPTADLFGDKITIRPAIDATGVTVVNGIKLWAQLTLADLVDDSDKPLLFDPVQRVISKGAAMDYCEAEEMWNKFREIKYEIFGDPRVINDKGIYGEIEALYSIRSGARRDGVRARRRSYK